MNILDPSRQPTYTYPQLARRQPVLQGAIDSLGLNMRWQGLAGQVSTSIVQQTMLMEISVVDTDPYRAKVLADAIAEQLILLSPAAASANDPEVVTFIQSQLDDLQVKIEDAEDDNEFKRVRVNLCGIVLNRLTGSAGYYHYYYYEENGERVRRKHKSWWERIFPWLSNQIDKAR